jgi:hypothetical protein
MQVVHLPVQVRGEVVRRGGGEAESEQSRDEHDRYQQA